MKLHIEIFYPHLVILPLTVRVRCEFSRYYGDILVNEQKLRFEERTEALYSFISGGVYLKHFV